MINWDGFRSPEFRNLSEEDQLWVFQQVFSSEPWYNEFGPDEKLKLREKVLGGAREGTPIPDYGPGFLQGVGEATQPYLEAFGRGGLRPFERATGMVGDVLPGRDPFEMGQEWFQSRYEPAPEDAGIPEKIIEGLAGAPGDIAMLMPWIGGAGVGLKALGVAPKLVPALANILGFGAAEAVPEALAGEDWESVLGSGAMGAGMGAAFGLLPPGLGRPAKSAALAGIGGGAAAVEPLLHGQAPDFEDVVSSAAVMGLFPWLEGGPGQPRFRELPPNEVNVPPEYREGQRAREQYRGPEPEIPVEEPIPEPGPRRGGPEPQRPTSKAEIADALASQPGPVGFVELRRIMEQEGGAVPATDLWALLEQMQKEGVVKSEGSRFELIQEAPEPITPEPPVEVPASPPEPLPEIPGVEVPPHPFEQPLVPERAPAGPVAVPEPIPPPVPEVRLPEPELPRAPEVQEVPKVEVEEPVQVESPSAPVSAVEVGKATSLQEIYELRARAERDGVKGEHVIKAIDAKERSLEKKERDRESREGLYDFFRENPVKMPEEPERGGLYKKMDRSEEYTEHYGPDGISTRSAGVPYEFRVSTKNRRKWRAASTIDKVIQMAYDRGLIDDPGMDTGSAVALMRQVIERRQEILKRPLDLEVRAKEEVAGSGYEQWWEERERMKAEQPPMGEVRLEEPEGVAAEEPFSKGTYTEQYRTQPEEFQGKLSPEIKKLRTELTHLIHPDVATSPEQRARFDDTFKEVTAAIARGDSRTLKEILEVVKSDRWKTGAAYDWGRHGFTEDLGTPEPQPAPERPQGRQPPTPPPEPVEPEPPPPPNLRAVELPETVEFGTVASEGHTPIVKDHLRNLFAEGQLKRNPNLKILVHRDTATGSRVIEMTRLVDPQTGKEKPLTTKNVEEAKAAFIEQLREEYGLEVGEDVGNVRIRKIFNEPGGLKLRALKIDPSYAGKVFAHEIGHSTLPPVARVRNALLADAGLLKDGKIRAELEELSKRWRAGFEEGGAYRKRVDEIYADAVSALINDPAWANQQAPRFANGFLRILEERPEVKRSYEDIQARIERGPEEVVTNFFGARVQEAATGAKERVKQFTTPEKPRENVLDQLGGAFWDRNLPAYTVEAKLKREGALRNVERTAVQMREEANYQSSRDALIAQDAMDIFVPVAKKYDSQLRNLAAKLGAEGAEPTDVIAAVLFQRGVKGFRKFKFQPGGGTPKRAQEVEDMAKRELGDEAFTEIQKSLTDYADKVGLPALDALLKARVITQHDYDNLSKNVPDYMTKTPLEKIVGEGKGQHRVTGPIKEEVGMVGEIGNPIMETVLKHIAINRLASRTEMTRALLDEARASGLVEVKEAKWDHKAGDFAKSEDPNAELITYIEEGKARGFYVPKEFARVFTSGFEQPHAVAKAAMAVGGVMREMFVTRNPLFAPFNLQRDLARNIANISRETNPAKAAFEMTKRYFAPFKEAHKAVWRHEYSPDVREMMEGGMLLSERLPGLKAMDVKGDIAHDILIQGMGGKQLDAFKSKLTRLWDALAYPTQVLEKMGKISAYKYLKEKAAAGEAGLTPGQIGHEVRTQASTPDFLRRANPVAHSLTNSLFLFSNVGKEGWRGDFEALKRDPKGVMLRRATMGVLPKMALAAGAAGLVGDEMKDIIDRIPNYYKMFYNVIPFGKTEGGKAVFFLFPVDHTTQLVGSQVWNALNAVIGNKVKAREVLDPFISAVPWTLPNVNPALDVLGHQLPAAASGRQPTDLYSGQKQISDKAMTAGPKARAEDFAKHVWSQVGPPILKIPSDQPKEIAGWLDKLLGTPVVGPSFERFIRVSDAGINEKFQREVVEPEKQKRRQELDKIDTAISDLIEKDLNPSDYTLAKLYNELKKQGMNAGSWGEFKNRYESLRAKEGRAEERISATATKRQMEQFKLLFPHLAGGEE